VLKNAVARERHGPRHHRPARRSGYADALGGGVHRLHHQHADDALDPHSPAESFWWSHIGWLLVDHPELTRYGIYERYAQDILRDRGLTVFQAAPRLVPEYHLRASFYKFPQFKLYSVESRYKVT
jgi:hypothetical protein